jgi:hypothetical protein
MKQWRNLCGGGKQGGKYTLPILFIPKNIFFGYLGEKEHGVYSVPNIVRVIKSRRMRLAGHVARMGEGRCVYRDFGGET